MRAGASAAAIAALLLAIGCGGESEKDLLASAKGYVEKQDHKAAIVQLKALLQKSPEIGEARFLLGKELMATGDFAAARIELSKAEDLRFDSNRVVPLLAKSLLLTGQLRQLTDVYSRTSLDDPAAMAELKATVGGAFAAQGQLEQAEAQINAALLANPRNVSARLVESRLVAHKGNLDKALSLADAILAESPGKREALQLKGDLLWLGKGDLGRAAETYRQILASDPSTLSARSALMAVLLAQRDLDGFRTQVSELKKLQPANPNTRFYETQLALLDRDVPKARELVQQLLKIAPDNARVLQLAGAIEASGGSLIVAETHLAKVLQIDPSQHNARRLLAQVYVRGGQSARALTTLAPLLERQPGTQELALAAEAHLQEGNATKAEVMYRQAAQLNPDDTKIRTALALTQIAKGNDELGFAQLEAVASRDATAYADLALISSLMRKSDWTAALKAIERLQSKQPDKPLPHHLRASVLAQRKDQTGARAAYEKALLVDAKYFPAVAGIAQLDFQDGKPDSARRRFEDLLARDPGNVRALLAIADLRQRTGAPKDEVAKLLLDAIRAAPQDAGPRLLLVEHHLRTREPKLALATAQEAVAALRDDPRSLQALGRAQLADGQVQQAISTFGKLANIQPGVPGPHLLLADAYVANKDKAAAEASLRKALEIAPNLPAAMTGLWQLAMAERRYPQALQVARQIQQAWPKDPAGLLLEADVHGAQRSFDAAAASTRAALGLRRTTQTAMKLHALLTVADRKGEADRLAADWLRAQPRDVEFVAHLGAMALDSKDYARAEARYREVLALAPDNVTALNNVAWLMSQQKKPGAVPMAEKAVSLAPDQPAIMDTLATALAAEAQIAKAVEWQRKAIAAAPETPQYRLHLAELLLQAGDRTGAKAELEALQKLGDKFASGQKRVDELLRTL